MLLDHNVLVHFDPKLPLLLSCDASSYGVGAVKSHIIDNKERPVLFAPSTLTSSEQNYSQLEACQLWAKVWQMKNTHPGSVIEKLRSCFIVLDCLCKLFQIIASPPPPPKKKICFRGVHNILCIQWHLGIKLTSLPSMFR
ncbi:hypothetical protein PR048_000157, partial [Dryococelus australis]